jgi:uncharacterized membrane protein
MMFDSLNEKQLTTWKMVPVTWLAFMIRLINLNGRFLWYDEAFAVLYAEKSINEMMAGTVTQVSGVAADVHPLFYYTLLHSWMQIIGQTPFSVRLLSVILSTLTVIIVFILSRYLFGNKVGIYAALVVALAPFLVYYGQETRMYALLGLAATSMVYTFVRAWTNNHWRHWLLMGILGAVTLYAHNLGAMFIASLDLWILWQWFRARRLNHLKGIILAHITMILLFAPWLTILPSQMGKIEQSYWVQKPNLVTLLQTTLIFHFAYDNQALPSWLLPLAFAMSLLIPAVLVLELRRRHKFHYVPKSPFKNSVSLLLFLIIGPVSLTFLISQIQPVYIIRALLPSAIMYIILLVSVLSAKSTPTPIKLGMAIPSLAIILLSLFNHYTYAQFPRSPFSEAVTYLRDTYDPATDVIVHSNKMTYFPSHFYDRQLPMAFIADKPGSAADTLALPTQEALGLFATTDIETAVSNQNVVWFLIFETALSEYEEATQPHPQIDWLDKNYTQSDLIRFNDLLLFKYSKTEQP